MSGSASISSRACCSVTVAGNTPPRIAPRSRMWRTSARVSTSVIAGIAWLASQLSQPWVARGRVVVVDRRAHDRRPRVHAV